MKFESKVGLGEVCIYNDVSSTRVLPDVLVKVVEIVFTMSGTHCYVEYFDDRRAMQRFMVHESQLVGDPDFDQEKGCYPSEVLTR